MCPPYHNPCLEHGAVVTVPHHDRKGPELIHLAFWWKDELSLRKS